MGSGSRGVQSKPSRAWDSKVTSCINLNQFIFQLHPTSMQENCRRKWISSQDKHNMHCKQPKTCLACCAKKAANTLKSAVVVIQHGLHRAVTRSRKDPLRASLDELVEKSAQICQYEATNVETKELGCVPNAQFEPNVGLRSAFEAGVHHLACNLICRTKACQQEISLRQSTAGSVLMTQVEEIRWCRRGNIREMKLT